MRQTQRFTEVRCGAYCCRCDFLYNSVTCFHPSAKAPINRPCSAGLTFHSRAFPALWARSPEIEHHASVQEGTCWLPWNSGAFVTVRKAVLPGKVLAHAPCLEGSESSSLKASGQSKGTVGQSVGGAKTSPPPPRLLLLNSPGSG